MDSKDAGINLDESTFSIVSEFESTTNMTDNIPQSSPHTTDSNGNTSFLSDDYHPTRSYIYKYEDIPHWPDCEDVSIKL
jgi:hypothetical protein